MGKALLLPASLLVPVPIMVGFGLLVALSDSPAAWLASGTAVAVMITLLSQRDAGSGDVFSPLFVGSVLLVINAVNGFVLHVEHRYPEAVLLTALGYLLVFAVFFLVAIGSNLGEAVARAFAGGLSSGFPRVLWPALLLCLPTGFLLFGFLMTKAGLNLGDPLALIGGIIVFRAAWGAGGNQYLMFAALFLIEGPFWAYLVRGGVSGAGRVGLAAYALLLLALAMLTGTRGEVFAIVSGLFLVYHCRVRRLELIRVAAFALVLLPLLSFFYEVEKQARGEPLEAIVVAATRVDPGAAALDTLLRFSGFEGFVKVIDASRWLTFPVGGSLRDAVYLPLPRSWYPDKPYSFNAQLLRIISPELSLYQYGEEYSALGEFYLNFGGMAGIVIGGWLFGVAIKTMHRIYCDHRDKPVFVFLYRPLLVLPMTWLSNGMINSEAQEILILNLLFGVIFLKLLGANLLHSRSAC